MARRRFLSEETQKEATAAIQAVEAQTSAEIVIALRPASVPRFWGSFAAGGVLAGLIGLWLLVAPQIYSWETIALEILGGILVGGLIASFLPRLQALLLPRGWQGRQTLQAAKAAFFDLGVSQTRDRTGILLFISLFEGRCEVVADSGVPVKDLGEPYSVVSGRLNAAVATGDPSAFFAAVRELGPILEKPLPRAEDDVNELPDEVQ